MIGDLARKVGQMDRRNLVVRVKAPQLDVDLPDVEVAGSGQMHGRLVVTEGFWRDLHRDGFASLPQHTTKPLAWQDVQHCLGQDGLRVDLWPLQTQRPFIQFAGGKRPHRASQPHRRRIHFPKLQAPSTHLPRRSSQIGDALPVRLM